MSTTNAEPAPTNTNAQALMIIEDAALQNKHTFGLPAKARHYTSVASLEGLKTSLEYAKEQALPVLILGGGSNTVFAADWEGLVIKVDIMGIEKINEDQSHYYVFAGAGVHWHSFVAYTLAEQWFGLENLALIPGTVGAAPIQNIGAYGVELAEYVHQVHVVDRATGDLEHFSAEQCQFGYRESIFKREAKDKYVIIGVSFCFPKQWTPRINYGNVAETIGEDEPTPERIFEAIVSIRQSKLPDPNNIGNAGSFFKNIHVDPEQAQSLKEQYPDMPQFAVETLNKVKIPSGWLIDQLGLKGYRHENVGVYDQQALVLVNHGEGTAEQLFALIEHIQEEVLTHFGLELEIEPNVIGDSPDFSL